MKRGIFIVSFILLICSCSNSAENHTGQFVIIKADDVRFDKDNVISPRWQRFIDYIENKKIKAGLGIIGDSFEEGGEEYYSLLKDIHKGGHIEFWNHGYDHHSNYTDKNRKSTFWEFRNTPYERQLEHITKTQDLAEEKLGITLHTFAAPHNKVDENTLKILEGIGELKVWLYGNPSFSKLNLGYTVQTEFPTHNPHYEKFVDNYKADLECIILQVHPNSWGDERFAQFEKIIEFLIGKGVTFVKPYEYYEILNNKQ